VQRNLKFWGAIVAVLSLLQAAVAFLVPKGSALTISSEAIDVALHVAATLAFLYNAQHFKWKNKHLLVSPGLLLGNAHGNQFSMDVLRSRPAPGSAQRVRGRHFFCFSPVSPCSQDFSSGPIAVPIQCTTKLPRSSSIGFMVALPLLLLRDSMAVCRARCSPIRTQLQHAPFGRGPGIIGLLLLLWRDSFGKWKRFYFTLLAAEMLSAGSAYLANRAIDANLYFPGSWYDVLIDISIAWFALSAFLGSGLLPEVSAEDHPDEKRDAG